MRNYAKRLGTVSKPTIFFDDEGPMPQMLWAEGQWVLHHRPPFLDEEQQALFHYVGEGSQEWVARRALAEPRLSYMHPKAQSFLRKLSDLNLYTDLWEALRRIGIDPGLAFNPNRVTARAEGRP